MRTLLRTFMTFFDEIYVYLDFRDRENFSILFLLRITQVLVLIDDIVNGFFVSFSVFPWKVIWLLTYPNWVSIPILCRITCSLGATKWLPRSWKSLIKSHYGYIKSSKSVWGRDVGHDEILSIDQKKIKVAVSNPPYFYYRGYFIA